MTDTIKLTAEPTGKRGQVPKFSRFPLAKILFLGLVPVAVLLHGCGKVEVSPMGRMAERLLPFEPMESVTNALMDFDSSRMLFTNKNVTFKWGYVAPNVKDKEYDFYLRYTCATKGDVDVLYLFFNADDELVAMQHSVPSGASLLPCRPNGAWIYLRGDESN